MIGKYIFFLNMHLETVKNSKDLFELSSKCLVKDTIEQLNDSYRLALSWPG